MNKNKDRDKDRDKDKDKDKDKGITGKLSLRLQGIYEMIPVINPPGRIIDVGTDHGYIPIHCLLTGKTSKAVASDIRSEPLDKAARNARKYNVSDNIEFFLTFGLEDIKLFPEDCVVIAGMGGHEIIDIISALDFISISDYSLPTFVLQPQKSAYELRSFLDDKGFTIQKEKIINDRGKFYTIIKAKYTNKSGVLEMIERYAGIGALNHKEYLKSFDQISTAVDYLSGLITSTAKKSIGDDSMSPLLEYIKELRLLLEKEANA